MDKQWMQWAVLEGGAKTATRLLNKSIGIASGSLAGSIIAPFVVGVVQTAVGFLGSKMRGKDLFMAPSRIFIAMLFGVVAAVMSILSVFSFTYSGADVGITTFIVTMSIIPGAFVDWIFFGHPLNMREWVGVGIFLAAGYAVLGFPDTAALRSLPAWVWITLGIALFAAVQEGFMQWQGRHTVDPVDPMVNSFWIGSATLIFSGIAFLFLRSWRVFPLLPGRFWISAFAIGLIVIGMHSFKFFAYRGGGFIALKKLVMQATYLISAVLLGVLFYAEPFTVGKSIGMAGYLVAFVFIDTGTWDAVVKKLEIEKIRK